MSSDDEINFQSSIYCHICKDVLGNNRVRNHCHLTGKYRGAAHENCNIQYVTPKFIPICFHNFSKYDCHLFIKELITKEYVCSGKKIKSVVNVIAKHKELYTSLSYSLFFSKKNVLKLKFIDSINFMSSKSL